MKKLLVLAGLLAVVGCSKQPTTIEPIDDASELKLGATAFASTVSKATEPLGATTLGVFVLTKSGDNQTDFTDTPWYNHLFTSDAASVISTTTSIVLRTETVYDIYAYAPREVTITTVTALVFEHGDDLLRAKKTAVTATAGTTSVDLEFDHLASQVSFQLAEATQGTIDFTNAAFEAVGFYSQGTLNLETGAVSITGTATAKVEVLNTPICVLPTNGAIPLDITVVIPPGNTGAGTYTGTAALTGDFVAGTSYVATITLTRINSDLDLSAVETDWVDATEQITVKP